MKIILPGVLVGVGGIGAVATTVGVVYPINRSNKDVIDDAIFDVKFSDLSSEIRKFADECNDKGEQYGKTVLKELEDIFEMLLGPQMKYSNNTKSNLDVRKDLLEKRLTGDERKLFADLYKEMEEFSKSLKNNQEKFDRYKEKLDKDN